MLRNLPEGYEGTGGKEQQDSGADEATEDVRAGQGNSGDGVRRRRSVTTPQFTFFISAVLRFRHSVFLHFCVFWLLVAFPVFCLHVSSIPLLHLAKADEESLKGKGTIHSPPALNFYTPCPKIRKRVENMCILQRDNLDCFSGGFFPS